MIRLFVAVSPPETVRLALSGLAAGLPGAAWVRPESLHLTLRFIGNVDDRLGRDVADALGAIEAPRFDIVLDRLGQFGRGAKVDTLWAGVRPEPRLDRLQAKVETALIRLGLEPERRKYHPHVTLARLKGTPARRVADFLGAVGTIPARTFAVDAFVLYSSHLSRSGAIYREEAVYPLRFA